MAGIAQDPASFSDNRNARLPGNVGVGRSFSDQVNDRVGSGSIVVYRPRAGTSIASPSYSATY